MSNSPNVLVIMTDQQKATASHLYGNTFCETPSMERLAEEGVLFEGAFLRPIPCAFQHEFHSGHRSFRIHTVAGAIRP